MQRFRGGLAFKAPRLLFHSTLGLRVIKKKKVRGLRFPDSAQMCSGDDLLRRFRD